MAQELANPLFIGYTIDAITRGDNGRVKQLVIYWIAITMGSGVFAGI